MASPVRASRRATLLLSLLLLAGSLAPVLASAAPPEATAQEPRDEVLSRLRVLQDLRDAGALDPVETAAAQAILLTHWQAAAVGRSLPPLDELSRHEGPADAALALAARFGVDPTEEQLARVRSLDALPTDQADALTLALDAFLAYDLATQQAFAAVPAEARAALAETLARAGTPAPLPDLDLLPVLASRNRLVAAGVALHEAFAPQTAAAPPPTLGLPSTCDPIVLAPAFLLETVGCDSYYEMRMAFVFDAGGNDRYFGNNGGSAFCIPEADVGAGALFDLGGDDLYRPIKCGDYDYGGGFNGGASAGSGFLFDSGGNDRYGLLQDYGSISGANGGGSAGAGLLLDVAGHDDYQGASGGVNGGGSLAGHGLLVDGNGDDEYWVGVGGTNGGGTFGGVGTLYDGSGNDYYDAWSPGTQAYASNGGGELGVGLLLDMNGVDRWIDWSHWGCRNDGYWPGPCTLVPKGTALGALIDDHTANLAGTFNTLSGVAPTAYWNARAVAGTGLGLADGVVKLVYGTGMGVAGQAVGIVLGLAGTVQGTLDPYVRQALDADADGHDVQAEAAGNSDPASAASTPDTDDDRDGIPNRHEPSRAHALGAFATAAARVSPSDHVWVHFGLPGATAAVSTPSGATLRITYVPQTGPSCPGALPKPVAALMHDCFLPVAVRVNLAGGVEVSRGAYEPGVSVPASSIRVVCTPAPGTPLAGPCLVGAAADGTWTLQNGLNFAGAPSGVQITVAGKTYVDSANGQDMAAGGSGQDSRSTLPGRVWNWRHQSSGTAYACSAGIAATCFAGAPHESALNAGFYPGG